MLVAMILFQPMRAGLFMLTITLVVADINTVDWYRIGKSVTVITVDKTDWTRKKMVRFAYSRH